MHARGIEHQSKGVENCLALLNIALACGHMGREGAGCFMVTGQGNGQGGREHGQKCDQLPGARSITDPAAREHVARVWGVRPEDIPGPGLSAVEIMNPYETVTRQKHAVSGSTCRRSPSTRGMSAVTTVSSTTFWCSTLLCSRLCSSVGGVPVPVPVMRDCIVPAMGSLRETGDALEVLIPHGEWPLPTYREMLFIK